MYVCTFSRLNLIYKKYIYLNSAICKITKKYITPVWQNKKCLCMNIKKKFFGFSIFPFDSYISIKKYIWRNFGLSFFFRPTKKKIDIFL